MRAVAAGLLRHRDPFVQSALALFAVLTAASGRAVSDHAEVIADVMTRCGLRTGPAGVDRWDVIEWVRPLWQTLQATTERRVLILDEKQLPGDHRAVALARTVLWPDG